MAAWLGDVGYPAVMHGPTTFPWPALFVPLAGTVSLFFWGCLPGMLKRADEVFRKSERQSQTLIHEQPLSRLMEATCEAFAMAFVVTGLACAAAWLASRLGFPVRGFVASGLVWCVHALTAVAAVHGWAKAPSRAAGDKQLVLVLDEPSHSIRMPARRGRSGVLIPFSSINSIALSQRAPEDSLLDLVIHYTASAGTPEVAIVDSWHTASPMRPKAEEFAAWLRNRVSLSPGVPSAPVQA